MKSREMTVYRARGNGKDLTVPMIMMQGKWLRDMGFAVGDRVSVTLQDHLPYQPEGAYAGRGDGQQIFRAAVC
jgi:hypothetical protein